MLRQVVGWSAPAVALVGLFAIQFFPGLIGVILAALVGLVVGFAAEGHGRLHPPFGTVRDRLGYTL